MAEESKRGKNFSRVHELEHFRGSDGKFEFKLSWPDQETAPQHWKQTNNPYLFRTPGVTGYEAIGVIHNERGWGGLQYDGKRACFNGSVHAPDDWCYAIGAWVAGASGPKGPVKSVEWHVKPSGGDWVLIMKQVFGRLLWCPPQVSLIKNPTEPNNPNYSILDKLENFRTEGKLELALSWPGSDLERQHWKQLSNPYIDQEPAVEGYEPISCPHTANMWCGLQYDDSKSILSGSSKVDASDKCFYAVGTFVDFKGGIPGPENPVQCVELHAKAGENWTLIMRQTAPVLVNGQPVWGKEPEFAAVPPRGAKSVGDAQSLENQITNAKGFVVEKEDERVAEQFVKRGCAFTLCLALFSPFLVLSTMFNRIGASERAESIVRLLLKTTTLFLFFWPIIFVLGFGSTESTKFGAGAWVIVLIITLLPWPQLVVNDMEWNTIDDFQSHRKWRWTIENVVAVLSLILAVLQLIALSWRLVPMADTGSSFMGFDLSAYKAFKTSVSELFSVFNLDFTIDFDELDWPLVKFWGSVVATLAWIIVFVGVGSLITLLLKRFNRGGEEQGYGRKDNVFVRVMEYMCCSYQLKTIEEYLAPDAIVNHMATVTRVRLSMYYVLYQSKAYRLAFSFLAEILFIPIVSAFLSAFDCTTQGNEVYTQDIQPERLCWVGSQRGEAILAMILLPIYLCTTMILAPLALADSDGLFVSGDLDVRYASLFLLIDKWGRFWVLIATIFLSQWPWVALTVNCTVNCYLAFTTEKNKPCSIPWVNVILASTFGASAFCSACLFLDLTGIPWIPMGLLIAGWIILLMITIYRVTHLLRAGYPSFRLIEAKGVRHKDTEPFDDTSLLRGSNHRIHSIKTFLQGKELKGFQVFYKVDLLTVAGPRHLGLQSVAGELTESKEFHLLADEGIKMLVIEKGGCAFRGINRIEFHTTKGRMHEAGDSMPNGEKLLVKAPGNAYIKAFHGGTGGHIHNIGLVVQNTY